jgi:hypothetical protein
VFTCKVLAPSTDLLSGLTAFKESGEVLSICSSGLVGCLGLNGVIDRCKSSGPHDWFEDGGV